MKFNEWISLICYRLHSKCSRLVVCLCIDACTWSLSNRNNFIQWEIFLFRFLFAVRYFDIDMYWPILLNRKKREPFFDTHRLLSQSYYILIELILNSLSFLRALTHIMCLRPVRNTHTCVSRSTLSCICVVQRYACYTLFFYYFFFCNNYRQNNCTLYMNSHHSKSMECIEKHFINCLWQNYLN